MLLEISLWARGRWRIRYGTRISGSSDGCSIPALQFGNLLPFPAWTLAWWLDCGHVGSCPISWSLWLFNPSLITSLRVAEQEGPQPDPPVRAVFVLPSAGSTLYLPHGQGLLFILVSTQISAPQRSLPWPAHLMCLPPPPTSPYTLHNITVLFSL